MFGDAVAISEEDFLAETEQHFEQLVKILLLILEHDVGCLLEEFTHLLH